MSCVPLPEILDLIVDHLYDELTTLKTRCIASRSWVLQTQHHLFVSVEFDTTKPHIQLWKKIFPYPSNSPAHYTCNLSIYGVSVVTAVGGWISAFHNIVHLYLERLDWASLIPFYRLLPTIRSLHLTCCTIGVFNLICSFPLLEDLVLNDLYCHEFASIPIRVHSYSFHHEVNIPTLATNFITLILEHFLYLILSSRLQHTNKTTILHSSQSTTEDDTLQVHNEEDKEEDLHNSGLLYRLVLSCRPPDPPPPLAHCNPLLG